MKLKSLFFGLMFSVMACIPAFAGIGLTGTIQYPNGAPVNGRLEIKMPRPGVLNTCVTPFKLVPTNSSIVKIVNGSVQGASLNFAPSNCLNPLSTYLVSIYDNQHNLLSQDYWFIMQSNGLGTLMDVSTLVYVTPAANYSPFPISVPNPVVSLPSVSQLITQPSGTSFAVTELQNNNKIQLDSTGFTITGPFTTSSSGVVLKGATSGTTTLKASAIAGSTTATFPANTGTVAELNLVQQWSSPQIYTPLFNLGSGSAIANTAVETVYYTANTAHIPANTITAVGTVLKYDFVALYSTTGTPTLDMRLRLDSLGGTLIVDSTALTMANNASNLPFHMILTCYFTAVGAGGSASCDAADMITAVQFLGQIGAFTLAFDTTVAHDIVPTAQWGTANPSNTTSGFREFAF